MGKKEFKSGLDAIFQGTTIAEPTETIGRKALVSGSTKGSRATFIVNDDTLLKLKAIAYWERKQIKDILDLALKGLINSYTPEKLDEIMKLYNEKMS